MSQTDKSSTLPALSWVCSSRSGGSGWRGSGPGSSRRWPSYTWRHRSRGRSPRWAPSPRWGRSARRGQGHTDHQAVAGLCQTPLLPLLLPPLQLLDHGHQLVITCLLVQEIEVLDRQKDTWGILLYTIPFKYLVVSKIFFSFKKLILLFQQGCIKSIKSDSKDI